MNSMKWENGNSKRKVLQHYYNGIALGNNHVIGETKSENMKLSYTSAKVALHLEIKERQ
jgi:hypothetical protein